MIKASAQKSLKDLGLSPEDNGEPHIGVQQGGWGYSPQLAGTKPDKCTVGPRSEVWTSRSSSISGDCQHANPVAPPTC